MQKRKTHLKEMFRAEINLSTEKKKVLSDPDSGFPINGVYLSTTVEFSEILPNA